MYEEKRSKKTRRKKGGRDKNKFVPKANRNMLAPGVQAVNDARGRAPQATMPPPKHLPFNVAPPPPSTKFNPAPPPKPFSPAPNQYDPAIAMNTWNSPQQMPKNNGGWETVSLPSEANTPGGPPPPPPPGKPVVDDKNRRLTPVGVSPTPAAKAVNIFDVNQSALNSSRRKKKKKKGKTDISPNVKTDFSTGESPTKWIEPTPALPPLKQQNDFANFPSLKDRSDLPSRPTGFGSQTSAGSSRKKRRKKKKRLNKFKSAEFKKPQSNFKPPSETAPLSPKPNYLSPLQQKPAAQAEERSRARGRKNSKNPMSSFFGVASNPPDEAAFDSAMSKMKMKMDMKKKTQNNDFFTDLAPKTKSREKSYQLQSKIQTQFGFLQSKFTHKEKNGRSRRPRRGQNRKGQPVPTLPPRNNRGAQQPQPSYSLY